jgi:hypothetical protein
MCNALREVVHGSPSSFGTLRFLSTIRSLISAELRSTVRVMNADWPALWDRIQARTIRVIDVISILLIDAIIIAVGYAFTRFAAHFAHSGSQFFDAARRFSEGAFLLLYVAMVFFDLYEYVRVEYQSTSGRERASNE